MNRLWCVAAMLLFGCVKNVPSPTVEAAEEYFPLGIGNSWSYREELLGKVRESKVEILANEEGVFLDSRGGRVRWDAYGFRDEIRYLLRVPLNKGREWTNVVSENSIEHYRIIEVSVPCEVRAGRFKDCVVVQSLTRLDSQKALENTLTFARGVGLVRLETFAQTSDKRLSQSKMELVSYNLKALNVGPRK